MKNMKGKTEKEKSKNKILAVAGKRPISTRGQIFEGIVTRKFPKRITIEFDRTVFIPKYERFLKKSTRIHARLPDQFASEINLGDLVKVQQCRPLSKIIHFMFIEKSKSGVKNNDRK